MTIFQKEYTAFIEKQDILLTKQREYEHSCREILLAQTVKLTEETGEVADAVLKSLNEQREEKYYDDKSTDLGAELADVIIVCSLLAKTANIDMDTALKNKMNEISKRG